MNLEEIKKAVDEGIPVYWIDKKHLVIKVIENKEHVYLIKSIDWGSYVNLTNKDGSLAGSREDNFKL